MEKLIHVAQIIGYCGEGGVESMIFHLYEKMDKSKVIFDFLVDEGSKSKIVNEDSVKRNGGQIVYIPNIKTIIFHPSKLVDLLRKGNYDIVHANKSTLNFFYLRAAKKAGISIRISHSHSTSSKKEWKKNLAKNLLKPLSKAEATAYFACSEYAGRYLFGNKAFDTGQVTIINNAVNIDDFKFNPFLREQIRNEFGIQKNDIVLGHVGRFQSQKNQLFLIDVFCAFHKQQPNSKLLIVGDGPLKNSLLAKVHDCGLEKNVIFTGSQSDPWKYYDAMDCFVLPSLYEGLPVVGVEAQVNGLPCFFSDTITKEIKLRGQSYFLSLDDSADVWASNIYDKVIEDGNDRVESYKEFYGSKYDLNQEANNLCTDYEKMMAIK